MQPAREYTNHEDVTMESEVRELLVEGLKDAYSAERQALRCMQQVLKKGSSPMLREGIQLHIPTQMQGLDP
jgi:ferritin-like metal-binding protein YciE